MKNIKSKKILSKKNKDIPFGFSSSAAYLMEPSVSEPSLWNTGFSAFKRRIEEQLQICGFSDNFFDDEELLPFYRMGESETYVLSALGCSVGM